MGGGDKVLYYQTAKDDTFGFMLIEAMNEDVLKTVYGDKNVTGTLADGLTVKATAVEAADSVWVVETILRGGAVKRIVIPCAHITEIEDIVYKDDEPLGYGVTLGATPDDSGVTHYEYIKGPDEYDRWKDVHRVCLFTIPRERLDNMELLDALAEADNGNVLAVSNAVTLLLGAGQKKALYDHLRTKAGNVPVAAVSAAGRGILSGGVQEKKKKLDPAHMAAQYPEELTCDMAETYHVLDWRALACRWRPRWRRACGRTAAPAWRWPGRKCPPRRCCWARRQMRCNCCCGRKPRTPSMAGTAPRPCAHPVGAGAGV